MKPRITAASREKARLGGHNASTFINAIRDVLGLEPIARAKSESTAPKNAHGNRADRTDYSHVHEHEDPARGYLDGGRRTPRRGSQ